MTFSFKHDMRDDNGNLFLLWKMDLRPRSGERYWKDPTPPFIVWEIAKKRHGDGEGYGVDEEQKYYKRFKQQKGGEEKRGDNFMILSEAEKKTLKIAVVETKAGDGEEEGMPSSWKGAFVAPGLKRP
jgi:hypothetical protein